MHPGIRHSTYPRILPVVTNDAREVGTPLLTPMGLLLSRITELVSEECIYSQPEGINLVSNPVKLGGPVGKDTAL